MNQSNPSSGRINVLSIDGGGIRGIIPAALLNAIENCVGRPLSEVFDLISGTSTGGIIALAIGTKAKGNGPYSPSEVLDIYRQHGAEIFQSHWYSAIKAYVHGPKYSADGLEAVLEQCFGEVQFSSALTPLLISSYDLASQAPYFFKSHRIAADSSWDWPIKVIARATSAAPTYFPPLRLMDGPKERALVDGGVFVNNPAMAAYAEARMLYPTAAEYFVLAVGTGNRDDKITYERAQGWGLVGWAKQIVPVMMDSVSEAVDYELDAMIGAAPCTNHHRLQPEITFASPDMDNVTPQNLGDLQKQAAQFLTANANEIQQICNELKKGRGSRMPGIGPQPSGAGAGRG